MVENKEGNIVKDFYIGQTRVKICDDYCKDKTKADVEATLRRISKSTIGALAKTVKEAV